MYSSSGRRNSLSGSNIHSSYLLNCQYSCQAILSHPIFWGWIQAKWVQFVNQIANVTKQNLVQKNILCHFFKVPSLNQDFITWSLMVLVFSLTHICLEMHMNIFWLRNRKTLSNSTQQCNSVVNLFSKGKGQSNMFFHV